MATMPDEIEMKPVASSNLSAVGYDPATQRLRVRFGTKPLIYEYADVPQAKFDGLMAAESKGSYFFHSIRNAFSVRVIEPSPKAETADEQLERLANARGPFDSPPVIGEPPKGKG